MLVAGLTFGSCAPPDAPPALARPLPDAMLTLLSPDTVVRKDVHRGVTHHYLWSSEGPWAIHLVQVAMSTSCDVAFEVLRPEAREEGGAGRERVSDMVQRSATPVLVAVNADFFTAEGSTVGAEVVAGEVTSAVARPTFAWRPGGAPWLGVASVAHDRMEVGWPVDRSVGDARTMAVGGFPDLIDEGDRVGDLEVGDRPSFAAARHPRTAVGYDTRSQTVWLVVVDGRQLPYSAGMSLPELAGLFEALGADEALNLDGGGSTVLVLDGRPTNRPSDPTGERAVANALALVRDLDACS